MIALQRSPVKQGSFLDTRTIGKSRKTKKKFMIGNNPLLKSKKSIDSADLIDFQKARKKRGWKR